MPDDDNSNVPNPNEDNEERLSQGFLDRIRSEARAVFSEEFKTELAESIVPALRDFVKKEMPNLPTLEQIAEATAPIVVRGLREARTTATEQVENARRMLTDSGAVPIDPSKVEVVPPPKPTDVISQITSAGLEIIKGWTELERVRKVADNPLQMLEQLKTSNPDMFEFAISKYSDSPAQNFEDQMWKFAPSIMRRMMEEEGIQDIRDRHRDGSGRRRHPLEDSPEPGPEKSEITPGRNGGEPETTAILTDEKLPETEDTEPGTVTQKRAGRTKLRDLADLA